MRALPKKGQLTNDTNNGDDGQSMKDHTVPVLLNHRTRDKTADELADEGQ